MPPRQWLFIAIMSLLVVVILAGEQLSVPPTKQSAISASHKGAANSPPNVVSPEATDERIARYTKWLAFFTAALVIVSAVQIAFLIRADKTARISADAAKGGADALPRAERAYIFIRIQRPVAPGFRVSIWDAHNDNVAVQFELINHGKTPAIVNKWSAALTQGAHSPGLIYRDSAAHNIIVPAGEEFPRHVRREWPRMPGAETGTVTFDTFQLRVALEPDGTFTVYDLAKWLETGATFLWFHGRIVYDDVFGKEHETRFCWRYDGQNNVFEQYGEEENKRT